MRAGDGLCDEAAVAVLVGDGPRYVRELVDWGTRFDRDPTAGSRSDARRRTACGACCTRATRPAARSAAVLWKRASAFGSVATINHAFVTDLVMEGGAVRGVHYVDRDGARHEVRARAVLLATGGAGQVFRETTNPPVATGDGIALAYRAGARLADLEFVQFHPTALNRAGAPRFLISEALRGEGARLVNDRGEAFMTRVHPDGDLAPRDVVARAIAREMERTGAPVYLTLAHLDAGYVLARFPTIADMCRRVGPRPRPRPDSGRARRALHHGRRRHRRMGPDVAPRALRRRRSGLHRRPRREPPREQLAARRARVRRARRDRDAGAAGRGAR